MPAELTRSFLEKVVRSSGWALSEVESLSLEGESISCLGDSFAGVGRLVYLSLARNNITSLLGVEHLSSLSTAILRANRVSSMSEVGRLARLPNLRNLDLRLNPVMAAPTIGGDGSGSGSSRNVGGGSGGRDRGVYSQHDATTADAPWGRPEQEGFFLARTPREMVLIALPQLVNLDGQKVGESERRELRRRRSAVATPSAMSADLREEGFASAGELRPAECRRRPEEAVDNLHRSSWPRHDSAVGYCATDSVVTAPQAFAGGERARLRCDGEMVGASRSYDERDLRRVGTVPSRGREAGRSADTGARKRDRTGAGVFESGGQDEGVPSLRAGPSRSSGNRTVDDVARNQQRPGHNRRAAGSQGKGIPPGAAPSTADDDDLAALWSELGEGFIEFQQPRAAAAATAADRSVSPPRPQCVPDCRRCGCSGSACECRDPLHSPARASRHTQLFAAELDESMSAVSFPGASRQTRHGPRIIEPRLLSDSEAGTKESALRRKGRSDDRSRRIGARSYADEWGTVGECDGDRRRIDGGGGGDSTSFRGSSGSSRVDTNPKLVVSSSLAPTAPRSSSSNSHGGNQEPAARVSRGPDAFAGRWGTTDAVRAAETKLVAHPGNRSNGGGKQQEARSRRHPPPEPTSARNVVRRQKSDSAAAPGSLSEPPSPQSQPVPAVPTDNATSTVAVARCTPPAQSGSSSSSTTTAAARAVEAFRRSSQRLGLVDAGKTDSRSPATYREGGVVAADECHGSVRSGPADAVSIDGGSPGPAPPVEATAELDTKAKHASVGGGKASEDSRGTDSTRTPSAIGGPSSTGTKPNAEPETSTALALPPTTETAVTSETMVSSEKAVSLFTEGVVKCQECGANFGKGYDKDSGAAAASAAAAGGSELHERWWAREREFTSRWAEREREFDARWTAREREYDNRRREESKEFTRGMRAMLFEAHNALIASNAWLLARLQTVESVQAPPPEAAEPDATTSATPAREPTLKGVGTTATIASRTGPRCPPPPQPTARRFVPDTYPTPLAEAEKEGQQRRQQQRKHSVLLPGGRPVLDASSLSGGGRHTPGGSTVTRDGDFPAVVTERVAAGTPVNVRAGSEHGTGHGTGGTGGRLRQAPPAVEDGSDRGPRGETGRVYAGGEAFQQPGDARNSRSLVGGVDPVVVVFPRPKTAACAPRETRELSGEASEFPIKIAASSETDARYPSAAAAGGRRDVPPPREFATGRRSEEACFDVQGVRGGCTGLERLVSAGDAVGAGRRREQNAGESALATAAATITKVEGSSASTPPAALGNIGSGSFLGGAEGGSGGGGSSNEIRGAPIPRSSGGGNDRREDGTGGAERGSAFASAHASVPAESNKRVATLGEENGNRVLGGKPADPSDAGGQKRVDVDAGVRVGVSSGGNGGRIVLGRNTTISPSEERDKRDAVWRRDRGVGGNGALCPDPEVTTSAPDG